MENYFQFFIYILNMGAELLRVLGDAEQDAMSAYCQTQAAEKARVIWLLEQSDSPAVKVIVWDEAAFEKLLEDLPFAEQLLKLLEVEGV